MRILRPVVTALTAFILIASAALAQNADPSAVWEMAWNARTEGPADIKLADQGVYHMSDEMVFLPKTEASMLMKSWGNSVGPSFLGMVVAKDENQLWIITLDHIRDGFIEDEEAADWDKAALLQALKDGNEQQNIERRKLGQPGLVVRGWIEEPNYDVATHRLVWSLEAADEGAPADQPATVNYNTYALGRDGYFEVNLITGTDTIAAEKAVAKEVLASVEYNEGKRYGDYVKGDAVAGYGIAALIGGGLVAKKAGLFAVIALFFAKFAKIIVIGAAVLIGGLAKVFGGRKSS